jgi:hypothetical protein
MPDEPAPPIPREQLAPAYVADTPLIEGDHPTANPDGVTVSNDDYYPKTQEEKARALGVEFATPSNVDPTAPYPTGNPRDDRQEVLDQSHTKQEQIEAKNQTDQHVANLAAGGLIEGGEQYQPNGEPDEPDGPDEPGPTEPWPGYPDTDPRPEEPET